MNIVHWLANPTKKVPKNKSNMFLVLTQDKKLFHFTHPNNWITVDEPYSAIGSGAQYALGALASGGSVTDAIKTASKLDPHTGLGVKVFTV